MREREAEYIVPEDCRIKLVTEGDTLTVEIENITGTKVRRVFEIRGWEEVETVAGERI